MAEANRRTLVLVLIGVGVLALAIVLALTTTGSGTNQGERFDLANYAAPEVEGEALPGLEDPATDPARGTPAPAVTAETFEEEQLTIRPAEEGPMVLLFLAHWCPHCQREVPVVQDFVEEGRVPEGVELRAVATAIDENAPNHPPDVWLRAEEWNVPTVVDTDGSIAEAYGLSAYPYWVVIDGEGNVDARFSGALGEDGLARLLETLAGKA